MKIMYGHRGEETNILYFLTKKPRPQKLEPFQQTCVVQKKKQNH